MDIIGRHFLPDFWQRHPESESALRGVAAIIAAASWHDEDDIRQHLGTAVTPAGEGRMILADPDGRFELTLRISYPLQLIHILAIREAPHE